jgi:hypothetical protein
MLPKDRLTVSTRRDRRFPIVAVAVLVVVLVVFGLANVGLVSSASHRRPYLVMAHSVAVGQIIGAGDVRVVDLAGGSALDALPASERSQIVGRAATVALRERSLVPRGAVAAPQGLGAGQALVALGLKAGQYPPGLRQGDHVMVVATGTAASAGFSGGTAAGPAGSSGPVVPASAGAALVPDALVVAVTAAASGSDEVVVSLAVAKALTPSVAGTASVGLASLALLGSGG